MAFLARFVIRADDQQTGILALGTRIRLQRHTGKSRHLGEVMFELLEHLRITFGLRTRRKGCNCPNSGHVTGIISAVAFSFIVHDPSGIMPCTSEKSWPAANRDSAASRFRCDNDGTWGA